MYLLCGCCRFIEIHIRIISRTSSCFCCHCCVNLNFQDYNRRPWDAQTLPDHYRCSISSWTVHCCSCACDCLYLPLQRYVNFLGLCVDFISLCFSFYSHHTYITISYLIICMKMLWGQSDSYKFENKISLLFLFVSCCTPWVQITYSFYSSFFVNHMMNVCISFASYARLLEVWYRIFKLIPHGQVLLKTDNHCKSFSYKGAWHDCS